MRGVNVCAIRREGIELERKRNAMEEEKKILGITEEELEQVKEDLGVDELEDFDISEDTKAEYEIVLIGYDENYDETDFEYLVDDGYTEEEEARKCFDYFTDLDNLAELMQKITVPENTKHVHIFLEFCYEFGPDMSECQDVIEEVELY